MAKRKKKGKPCLQCGQGNPTRTICGDCMCSCGRLKILCECPEGDKRRADNLAKHTR
jgi:hypothetical protein